MGDPRTGGANRREPAVLIGTLLTLFLAACGSGAGESGPVDPEPTAAVTTAAPPMAGNGSSASADESQAKAPECDPGSRTRPGDASRADDARNTVGSSLRDLAADSPEPTRDQVRSSLESAGFAAEKTEVSIFAHADGAGSGSD